MDTTFSELIKAMKARKAEVIREVNDHFEQEKQQIQNEETKWMDKQKICEELLILSSKADSDMEMLHKSKWIVDGLD